MLANLEELMNSKDKVLIEEWPSEEVIDTWGHGNSLGSRYASAEIDAELRASLFCDQTTPAAAVALDALLDTLEIVMPPNQRAYACAYLSLLGVKEQHRDEIHTRTMAKLSRHIGDLRKPLLRAYRLFEQWNLLRLSNLEDTLRTTEFALDQHLSLFNAFPVKDDIEGLFDMEMADSIAHEDERVTMG